MQTAVVRSADKALAGAGSTARALLEESEIGLVAMDRRGRVLLANAAAWRLLGSDGEAAWAAVRGFALDTGRSSMKLVGVAGQALTVTRRQGQAGKAGKVLLAILAAPEKSSADVLTGLATRDEFMRHVARTCAEGSGRMAIVKVDLDRFRAVNATMGYVAGDALLKLVAQRLRGTFRATDMVSRTGGTEFAVAMAAGSEVGSLANRLIGVLTRPYLVERQAAVVGASVGIAFAMAGSSDPVAVIREADIALQQAKADGTGVVRIYDEMIGNRARTSYALADDLRRAIPLQQLELHYQPQISLITGRLTHFEALVRWRHPEHGMIGPDQFIPVAEETGLVIPLGDWVLFEACRQAMTWPAKITVAVNVSSMQLLDGQRLPRTIATALEATGLPASRLEIEVTESALVREAEALEVLTAIHSSGVRVSMDDFGTGYSSLSQLRRLPVDALKIDGSFISDVGDAGEADAMVRAIAALGQALGLTIIAEGVETAEQEAVCRTAGCTSIQGYLISRPVPADRLAALIERFS